MNQRQEQPFERRLRLLAGKAADQIRAGANQKRGHAQKSLGSEADICVQEADDIRASQSRERIAGVLFAIPAPGQRR